MGAYRKRYVRVIGLPAAEAEDPLVSLTATMTATTAVVSALTQP
jgi:hypothetical protein